MNEFEASIIWMDRRPVLRGENLLIRCGTQETSCFIKEIKHKLNTGQLVEKQNDIEQLECLDAGKIVMREELFCRRVYDRTVTRV